LDQRNGDVLGRGAAKAPRSGRARRRAAALLALFAGFVGERAAHAGDTDVHVLPARVEVVPTQTAPANLADDESVRKLSAEIDATLREAALDLGLTVAPLRPGADATVPPSIVGFAPSDWVVAPTFRVDERGVHLRLVAVAPGSRVELAREEALAHAELASLDVRTVVMLRDLVETGRTGMRPKTTAKVALPPPDPGAPRSQGRPVLALNAAIFGGYVGFTIQRASGSADSRLVYPLVALGAGLGLGASLLVADEWDIGVGDAWFLSAGGVWPTLSGVLIAESYGASPNSQYLYGLSAATAGISLSAIAIAIEPMSEGGAVLAHSGGAFGSLLGAMTQMAVEGKTGEPLTRGLGFGAGAGVLLGGVMATQVTASPSRVLLVDLSASLGWLAGAALASPLLLTEETDPTRTRLWLVSAGVGTIAGGVIGWYATAPRPGATDSGSLPFIPYANVTPAARGTGFELGVHGRF
jgi:hypothetical protein